MIFNVISCCFPCIRKFFDSKNDPAKEQTMRIMEMVKPYFLSAYTEGSSRDRETRMIYGKPYCVERANHGLAHGLRQGALAKDIFDLLVRSPLKDSSGIVAWAREKKRLDPNWSEKLQMAASFQRAGRQRECSSTSHPELYKRYELQDAVYFRQHAQNCSLFVNDFERLVFEEAILWSNPGTLNEDEVQDLKYLRRILHAAHTLDLRRMLSFDGARIQRDAMDQLFGGSFPGEGRAFQRLLWNRSGSYLKTTGDRDLVSGRYYQNRFFIQSPSEVVNAICKVTQRSMVF